MLGKANLQLQTHIWDILAQAEWHRLKLGVDDCHDVLLVILLLLARVVGHGVMLLLQAVNVIAAALDVSLTKIQTYKDIEIWAYKDTKIHRYKFTIKKLERCLFRKKDVTRNRDTTQYEVQRYQNKKPPTGLSLSFTSFSSSVRR